jgi:hypothetical protein
MIEIVATILMAGILQIRWTDVWAEMLETVGATI